VTHRCNARSPGAPTSDAAVNRPISVQIIELSRGEEPGEATVAICALDLGPEKTDLVKQPRDEIDLLECLDCLTSLKA
jgi:hypothetical protein